MMGCYNMFLKENDGLFYWLDELRFMGHPVYVATFNEMNFWVGLALKVL